MSGPAPSGRPRLPCILEVIDPDDILVVNINNRWFRSFTSNSDRYPLRIEVPREFINEGWNLVTGDYTNIALTTSKNEATVNYRILIGDQTRVHVHYDTEVMPHTFNITFKDTFNTKALKPSQTGAPRQVRKTGGSERFDKFMDWTNKDKPGG